MTAKFLFILVSTTFSLSLCQEQSGILKVDSGDDFEELHWWGKPDQPSFAENKSQVLECPTAPLANGYVYFCGVQDYVNQKIVVQLDFGDSVPYYGLYLRYCLVVGNPNMTSAYVSPVQNSSERMRRGRLEPTDGFHWTETIKELDPTEISNNDGRLVEFGVDFLQEGECFLLDKIGLVYGQSMTMEQIHSEFDGNTGLTTTASTTMETTASAITDPNTPRPSTAATVRSTTTDVPLTSTSPYTGPSSTFTMPPSYNSSSTTAIAPISSAVTTTTSSTMAPDMTTSLTSTSSAPGQSTSWNSEEPTAGTNSPTTPNQVPQTTTEPGVSNTTTDSTTKVTSQSTTTVPTESTTKGNKTSDGVPGTTASEAEPSSTVVSSSTEPAYSGLPNASVSMGSSTPFITTEQMTASTEMSSTSDSNLTSSTDAAGSTSTLSVPTDSTVTSESPGTSNSIPSTSLESTTLVMPNTTLDSSTRRYTTPAAVPSSTAKIHPVHNSHQELIIVFVLLPLIALGGLVVLCCYYFRRYRDSLKHYRCV